METGAVVARLEALSQMDAAGLRVEWHKLYGSAPPCYMSRDLLRLMLGYRIQEQAYGGLGKSVERRIRALSDSGASGSASAVPGPTLPSAGSRLVREWQGQTHTVLVLGDGFEYQGQRHDSLSEVAGVITGAHWSGPRFFGLKSKPTSNGQSEPADG